MLTDEGKLICARCQEVMFEADDFAPGQKELFRGHIARGTEYLCERCFRRAERAARDLYLRNR